MMPQKCSFVDSFEQFEARFAAFRDKSATVPTKTSGHLRRFVRRRIMKSFNLTRSLRAEATLFGCSAHAAAGDRLKEIGDHRPVGELVVEGRLRLLVSPRDGVLPGIPDDRRDQLEM